MAHRTGWITKDDRVLWGVLGLIKAIDKFDIDRGFKFSTYAHFCIKGEILTNIKILSKSKKISKKKLKNIGGYDGQVTKGIFFI